MLGVEDVRLLGFADQRLDTVPLTEIIAPLLRIVREVRPAVVLGQFGGDVNRDHKCCSRRCWSPRGRPSRGSRRFTRSRRRAARLGYPRAFRPDTWVDISTTLERKLRAMACYRSEVRQPPHPRSIEALRQRAQAWGSHCCIEAAEVFATVRRTARNGAPPL